MLQFKDHALAGRELVQSVVDPRPQFAAHQIALGVGASPSVGNLGQNVPTDGDRMALVSTGLGLTTQSGSFAQKVCLPPLPAGATQLILQYDWNFFSEEFMEFCGSPYQDFFQVTFGNNVLQGTKIDDLCSDALIHLDDVGFDKGDVWMTGWRTQMVDVTLFAGATDTLTFAAGDVGDSIYDTVILVDNVRLIVQ